MNYDSNAEIAARLDEVADLLAEQEANQFRIKSYRQAADLLRQMENPVRLLVQKKGVNGLMELPGIGERLAHAIYQLVQTGKLLFLDQLRGVSDPVTLLQSAPGVGPVLARRLHDDLGIASLEDLEEAAHDGRLAKLEGVGTKRINNIRDVLASRLGHPKPRNQSTQNFTAPAVAEILDVDSEYHRKASANQLKKIAPRRLNPTHEAWLPVLHTTRGARQYTVLFSNTARAHDLKKEHDWVVVYYTEGDRERQCTVITAHSGALAGERVVRGREAECLKYYEQKG